MPKSKGRTKSRATRARASTRSQETARERRAGVARKRIWWGLAVLGLAMFLVGNIGARTGLAILPFDPHHVVTQWGGAILGIVALLAATRR